MAEAGAQCSAAAPELDAPPLEEPELELELELTPELEPDAPEELLPETPELLEPEPDELLPAAPELLELELPEELEPLEELDAVAVLLPLPEQPASAAAPNNSADSMGKRMVMIPGLVVLAQCARRPLQTMHRYCTGARRAPA